MIVIVRLSGANLKDTGISFVDKSAHLAASRRSSKAAFPLKFTRSVTVSGAGENNGDFALVLGEGDGEGGGLAEGDAEGAGRGDSPIKIAPSGEAAGSALATGSFQVT